MTEKTEKIINSLPMKVWKEILDGSGFQLTDEYKEYLEKEIAESHDITKSDFGFKEINI